MTSRNLTLIASVIDVNIKPSTTALVYVTRGLHHWVCLKCGTAGIPSIDDEHHKSATGRLIDHWRKHHGSVTNGLRIQEVRVDGK